MTLSPQAEDAEAVTTDEHYRVAATLPSSSPPPENVESLKDNIRETMTTVDQGMSVEEIERVIAERVANAIEAIAIYETKTNMARRHYKRDCPERKNQSHKNPNWSAEVLERGFPIFLALVSAKEVKTSRRRSAEDVPIVQGLPVECLLENRPKVKFEWGDKQEAAFQLLKQKLCSAPILALLEGSEDFIAYCDASKKGLGAVLMQREKKEPRTTVKSLSLSHGNIAWIFPNRSWMLMMKREDQRTLSSEGRWGNVIGKR
ncbi:putative reverse transcriptase domain-containing protein [Tanacetum coccineum]|uniref:Reverse transcriptase domain-containing protein n=1 Tax=Tanacetum coccineum TaxID=301880 RepID=A0ABQ5E2S8_9ASTR